MSLKYVGYQKALLRKRSYNLNPYTKDEEMHLRHLSLYHGTQFYKIFS